MRTYPQYNYLRFGTYFLPEARLVAAGSLLSSRTICAVASRWYAARVQFAVNMLPALTEALFAAANEH